MKIVIALSLVLGIAVGTYGGLSSHATPSSVFLGIAAFTLMMVVGLLFRAARALVEEGGVEVAQATGRRKKELEREKASLLKALKELEFDHEMGKVSLGDFREIGGQYRARAMRVLRQLDEQGADYRELVEKELKARLGAKQSEPAEAKTEAKAEEAKPEAKAEARGESKIARCAACGTSNDSDAVFCKKCGKKVAA